MWTIEESGPKSPSWNMEADIQCLETIEIPTLRFYEWNCPSVTYGYFLNPSDYFKPNSQLNFARRPTGGGVIFHLDDLAFSVIVPASHPFYSLNSLHSYQMINSLVLEAIQKVVPLKGLILQQDLPEAPRGGFCMAKPTKYDLLHEGKKVGGAAQRKTKKGLLHQSSLCLKMPSLPFLEEVLKPGTSIPSDILESSASLGVHLKEQLKTELIQIFQRL